MKKRYFGLDAVRILALCLLLWLHFLLRNGFYYKPVNTVWMTAAAAGRVIFMCCIPLFLMLTGYLKCGKEWTKNYYASLVPILTSWVLISGICLVYKITVDHTEKTPYQWVTEFFGFSLADYSWYIGMYIGLMVVTPILNTAWNQVRTKKMHQVMTVSLVLLTMLPNSVNGIAWDGENKFNILPNYWSGLYYLAYYLIGCYIRTYQPRVRKRFSVPAILVISAVFALINRYTGGGESKFYDGYHISYSHLGTAAISVLLFLSVYRLECRKPAVRGAAAVVSGVTLEMYLLSCVFDKKIYAYQKGAYDAGQYWWRGLLACGLVFILSFISGFLVHRISLFLTAFLTNCVKRGKKVTQFEQKSKKRKEKSKNSLIYNEI